MATKCLFKTLCHIYLIPHGSQKKGKLKGFHLNGKQVPFKNTIQRFLFPQRPQKKRKLKVFHLDGDQMSFQNTHLFTHRPQKKKIERLSPEWRPKYSTKCIYFHRGHKGTEIWKAFTWMATKCIFKILYQIYLFPHRPQKIKKSWKAFTWMATKCLFKIFYKIYLFPHRPQKKGKLKGLYIDGDQVSFQNTLPNLFVSTQVTKERKNKRLSLSVFFWNLFASRQVCSLVVRPGVGRQRVKDTSDGSPAECRGVHACQDSLICGWARGGKRRRLWNEFGCKLQLSKCAWLYLLQKLWNYILPVLQRS